MSFDDPTTYDAFVIGGGAAGLSGALMLGRSRRRVLVLDAGEPRNAPAAGVHGFLTRDGIPPRELVAKGHAEVEHYGGEIRKTTVTSASREDDGTFTITLADGDSVHARRVLVATGLHDALPEVDGLRDRWGRDVLHCPYCHGWEVRDQQIAILATGPHATHQGLLFRQLSDDVTVLLHTAPTQDETARAQLEARGVRFVEGEVTRVVTTDDRLSGVELATGETVPCEALVVGPTFHARLDGLEGLGIETVEHQMGVGEHVVVDFAGRTNVPGVWAAGNVADLMAQVVGAAEQGVRAGAHINADLASEEARAALEAVAS